MAFVILWRSILKYDLPLSLAMSAFARAYVSPRVGDPILAAAETIVLFAIFAVTAGLAAALFLLWLFHRSELPFYRNSPAGFARPLAASILATVAVSILFLVAGMALKATAA